MKNRFSVAIAMIALTVSLAQARGQEWFGRWGTNDAQVQIAKKSLAKQAKARQIAQSMETTSASLLPDRLPIGDEMTLRTWDVSTNSIELLVWIQLSFYQTNDTWAYYTEAIFTDGYSSFAAFVDDVGVAGTKTIAAFKANPGEWSAYDGTDMYIDVIINYFCWYTSDEPIYNIGGFWADFKAGPFSGITPDLFRQSCYASDPYEQAVVYIPGLSNVDMAVYTADATNRLTWNARDGMQTPNGWPANESVNATANQYLCLDGWFSLGQYPMSVTLTATNGETATYTRYGDKLVAPRLKMGMVQNTNSSSATDPTNVSHKAVTITVPRGSVTTLYSSLDLKNWSAVGTYRSGTNSTLNIPIVGSQSLIPSQFFKASCCIDLQ